MCVVRVRVETLLWCTLNSKGQKLPEIMGGHVEMCDGLTYAQSTYWRKEALVAILIVGAEQC